ncbi:MAG: hypothetical protein ACF788_11310 [Novipirellula sp. JB048]
MRAWLRHLRERWNDWCGDRDMELAIRKHLSQNGYYGQTAKLKNVRLVAAERPGWLQVFRFEATARRVPPEASPTDREPVYREPVYRELYGLVKDDLRHNLNVVRVFDHEQERRSLFVRWSEGLICLRGAHGLKSL